MAKKKAAAKKGTQLTLDPKPLKVVKGPSKTFVPGGVVFEVMAVIPVQAYGNIQPKVQIVCNTIEEGRAAVMPVIEALFAQYAETKPGFLGKIEVTEKVVVAAPKPAPEAPKQAQTAPAPQATTPAAPAATASSEAAVAKPEPVLKAEKAIKLAATEENATLVQDQIEKSTKIPPEYKPALLELCLKRRSELSKAEL